MATFPIIQRSIKRGNVRQFDESYQKGFKSAQANEVDADFNILYDSWNRLETTTVISPDPPPDPVQGQMWWRSDPDGNLFIWYNDGTSQQWVPAVPTGTAALAAALGDATGTLLDKINELTARVEALEGK